MIAWCMPLPSIAGEDMKTINQLGTAAPVQGGGQLSTLLGISALYIGFGMTMGLIQGGFPTIMRAQGVSIGSVGWLYALYLPLGVAFLWSPLIDRCQPPFFARGVGWIVPMQVAAALTVALVALLEHASPGVLFLMGLFVAFAMATMDIALDAMAVKRIHPSWRPRAAACKLAALSLGAMIGGGAFVAMFHIYGWQAIFLCYAACLLVLVLPVIRLCKAPFGEPVITREHQASLFNLLRQPRQRKRLVLLTLACCVIFPLSALNRLMLVDLQVPMAQIGGIIGTAGPVFMLLTAAISAPLMRWRGLFGALVLFTLLGLFALAAMATGFTLRMPWLAMAGTLVIGAAMSGIFVVLSARILGWSQGDQPATDYATFYGVGRFVSTFATIAVAQIVTWISWLPFYLCGALALLIITGLLRTSMAEKDE